MFVTPKVMLTIPINKKNTRENINIPFTNSLAISGVPEIMKNPIINMPPRIIKIENMNIMNDLITLTRMFFLQIIPTDRQTNKS